MYVLPKNKVRKITLRSWDNVMIIFCLKDLSVVQTAGKKPCKKLDLWFKIRFFPFSFTTLYSFNFFKSFCAQVFDNLQIFVSTYWVFLLSKKICFIHFLNDFYFLLLLYCKFVSLSRRISLFEQLIIYNHLK